MGSRRGDGEMTDNKVFFIHINKTGGTSIRNGLGLQKLSKKHQTAIQIQQVWGLECWATAFKFSFVRNPSDKVVSHYHFRVKKNNINPNSIDLKNWVKLSYGQQDPRFYDNPQMFAPQLEWLVSQNGEIELDFIGRFENIRSDFERLANILGVNAELPHLNATTREYYRYYYNDETREIGRKWFAKDIEFFGYEF
jgi:hypothetical protein